MTNVLVSTHTPIVASGRAVRTHGIARVLAEHDGLELVYQRFEGDQPDARFSSIDGVRMHEVVTRRDGRRLAAYLTARARGVPASLARGISPELIDAVRTVAEEAAPRLLVADGPIAAATLTMLAKRRDVIYNAHNFESGFRHEAGMSGRGSPRQLRRFEQHLLELARESWMVSHSDMAAAAELCPPAQLRYMPNVVDVAAIDPVLPPVGVRRVMFVANFNYRPNSVGLQFMVDEVMPLVWDELPDATLALVGGGLDANTFDDPRIEKRGFVSDLAGVYSDASCVVVPLLLGGGTPLKLVEALAYGLPIIATPRAVRGLEAIDGVHCLVADGGDAFAAALTQVLRDGDREIGRRGRELASERYSIEALSALLAQ
jgi:polysaccharide biosynthesis protein PslH